MNKAELKAMLSIAKKLDWNGKPALEVIESINQMVLNQQSLELDTVGECFDYEETLLSIALWDKDKILSTRVVFDYETLIGWGVDTFCEDMGLDYLDFRAMMDYYENVAPQLIADTIEKEEEEELYYNSIYDDVIWMSNHC